MTTIISESYYQDFLNSYEGNLYFNFLEKIELQTIIEDTFCKNNEQILQIQCDLIDEIFSLKVLQYRKGSSDYDTLYEDLIDEINNPPTQEQIKERRKEGLSKKIDTWRKNYLSQKNFLDPFNPTDTKIEKCLSKAKFWAQDRLELPPISNNANRDVYLLHVKRSFHAIEFSSKKPTLVLKGNPPIEDLLTTTQQSARLEELVWKAVNLLDISQYFAPTTRTSIETASGKYKGSVQPFLKGQHLIDLVDSQDLSTLDERGVLFALLAALFIGTMDAHGANIMIINEGKTPIYFDNGSSFPHSNGVFKVSDWYHPSFRNQLLYFPKAYRKLSIEEKEEIKEKVDYALSKKDALYQLFENTKKERPFPYGWFFPGLMIDAYEERVTNLMNGLDKCHTPFDLVLTADPTTKYLMTLRITTTYFNEEASILSYTPTEENLPDGAFMGKLIYDLEIVMDYMDYCGEFLAKYEVLNLKKLQEISKEELIWEEWILKILSYVDENRETTLTEEERKQNQQDQEEIVKALKDIAYTDNKDCDPDCL